MIRLIALFCALLFPAFLNAKTVPLSAKEIICRSDTIVLAKVDRAYLSGRVNSDDVEEVVVQFDVKKRWLGKPSEKISLVSLPTMADEPKFVVGLEYVLFLIKNKWVLYKAEIIPGESGLEFAPDEFNEVKFRLSDLSENIAAIRKQCKPLMKRISSFLETFFPKTARQVPHAHEESSPKTDTTCGNAFWPTHDNCEEVLPSESVICDSTHIAIGKVIEATSLGAPEGGTNLKVVIEDYWRGSGEKIITLKYFPKEDKKWRLLAGLKYIYFMQHKDGRYVFSYDGGKFLVAGDNDDAAIIYECPLGCPLIKELSQYKSEVLKTSSNLCD
jgi:hypothetical protein